MIVDSPVQSTPTEFKVHSQISVKKTPGGELSQRSMHGSSEYCTPANQPTEMWESQDDCMPPTPEHPTKRPRYDEYSLMDGDSIIQSDFNSSSDDLSASRRLSNIGSFIQNDHIMARPANSNVFTPARQRDLSQWYLHNRRSRDEPRPIFDYEDTSSTWARLREEFVAGDKVGGGNFGSVTICKNRLDGCKYAVKKMKKTVNSDAKAAISEVFALAALSSSSYIVRYHSAWCDESQQLNIQMENCPFGTLTDRSSDLFPPTAPPASREKMAVALITQLATGIREMHAHGIAHLDLKPDNILLTHSQPDTLAGDVLGYHCKIADFGLAVSTTSPDSYIKEGDRCYCAQELLESRIQMDDLKRCDIFAFGASVYQLVRGAPLPGGGDEYQNLRSLGMDNMLPDLDGFSKPFVTLLTRMMHRNPAERPSAAQILCDPVIEPLASQLRTAQNRIIALNTSLLAEQRRIELCNHVLTSRLSRTGGPSMEYASPTQSMLARPQSFSNRVPPTPLPVPHATPARIQQSPFRPHRCLTERMESPTTPTLTSLFDRRVYIASDTPSPVANHVIPFPKLQDD